MERKIALAVIGGGPAGMSAAIAAYEAGLRDILIIERDKALGGILQQCIHSGFGLHKFGTELTGPEYAGRLEKQVRELGIPVMLDTMVTSLSPERIITATNPSDGIFNIKADTIILATGCRERPRGALNIPGTRPSGIFTAGTAQKLINMKGYMPGKSVVILGSGDIGLIMARRMTLEGAKVKAVCELMPYPGGLARNIEQCLNDFDIPLYLSHTITEIHGVDRLTGVTVSEVDEKRLPVPGTERYVECDTLLLSVGLIPENEIAKSAGIKLDPVTGGAIVDDLRQTSVPGIFECGNALHVHDLADYVSDEAEIAGNSAAKLIMSGSNEQGEVLVKAGSNVRYTVPQRIGKKDGATVYFRVTAIMRGVSAVLRDEKGNVIVSKKCPKVAPGEMQTIAVKSGSIDGCGELTLSIE